MFRVQENEDGTTSIFCKTTGKHIYTLRSNNQPRIPERTTLNRPINVVVPSRQFGSSSRSPNEESEQDIVPDQDFDFDISNSNTKCLLHPIPISFTNEDVTEDYFLETATEEEFARSLNLVPTKKFQEEPIEKILKQFPLRLLSRSKAFRSVDISSEDWQYHKPPDDLPLSSNLGVKFLKLNEERNFFNEHKLSIAIKKYDAFCRFPFNTPNPAECNFPKLRCREKKYYPVVTTTKASKHEATHVYTYGRRQRWERMQTLKTGLDAEGRRLLRICNAKQCSVKLERLKDEEIEYWRTKKSEPILVILDDSDDDDQTYNSAVPLHNQSSVIFEIPSKNFSAVNTKFISILKPISHQVPPVSNQSEINTVLNKNVVNANVSKSVIQPFFTASTSSGLVSLPNTPIKPSTYKPRVNTLEDRKLARRKGCKKCHVRLIDVSKRIHRFRNDYYVKSTNIRVPFYASHLALTHFANNSNITTNFCLTERPRSLSINNSYSNQTGSLRHNMLAEKSPIINTPHKGQNQALVPISQHRSSSAPLEETDGIDTLKIIPCVDLTVDSSPEPDSNNQCLVPKKFFVTQWLFRCFGCGYKRLFTNEASRFKVSNVVNAAIDEHMKTYHSVDKPEDFLSSYLDSFNNCSIIEAFPGYKGN